MPNYKLKVNKPPLFSLILLISFPSVVGVLISAALPAISDYYSQTDAYTKYLITFFIVGYAIGQLLYSPLANRFGRKNAIYTGLILYLISCLISIWAIYVPNIKLLIFSRFLMALGSCVGMVMTFTIINDYFYEKEAREITAYAMLSFSFMPGLALTLGGLITTYFKWEGCFYFLILYGAFIAYTCSFLPETLIKKNQDALKLKLLFTNYFHAFSTYRLVLFSLSYGLMAAYIYIIATSAPFIAIDKLKLKASVYASLILIPYLGQFIGAFLAGKLSHRISAYKAIGISYLSILFGSLSIFFFFLFGYVSVFTLIAPVFFIMMGIPLSNSSLSVMALLKYDDKATGASVMSFITMTVAVLFAFMLTLIDQTHIMIMPTVFVLIISLAFVLFCLSKSKFPH